MLSMIRFHPQPMLPLRLHPGDDLRLRLEQAVGAAGWPGAFVVSGIGSLTVAVLRYAGAEQTTRIHADLELLSLAGSISADGAHLHAVVADAQGRVLGGAPLPRFFGAHHRGDPAGTRAR